jgi:hypothetical protein
MFVGRRKAVARLETAIIHVKTVARCKDFMFASFALGGPFGWLDHCSSCWWLLLGLMPTGDTCTQESYMYVYLLYECDHVMYVLEYVIDHSSTRSIFKQHKKRRSWGGLLFEACRIDCNFSEAMYMYYLHASLRARA